MAAQSKTEQPVAPPSYNEAVNGSASNVSSSIDLPDNFEGTVEVNDDPPNKYDIEKCRDLVVLDGNGESHPFSSLYAGEGMAKRHLIIFVRHFFCGVSPPLPSMLFATPLRTALLTFAAVTM